MEWNILFHCFIQIQCPQVDDLLHTPEAKSKIHKEQTGSYHQQLSRQEKNFPYSSVILLRQYFSDAQNINKAGTRPIVANRARVRCGRAGVSESARVGCGHAQITFPSSGTH